MSKKEKLKSGELPKEVAEKYTVAQGFGIGPCRHKGRNYDLTKITLEEADNLVKDGFNVLLPKKVSPVKP